MALIRPVVLVYQEFATPTVVTTTPDLNCLVVGPAYWIQDYFVPNSSPQAYADKASLGLGTDYGTLEGPIGTTTPVGTGVITVATPPNNAVGALLDADSVAVYMDNAHVVITSGTAGTTSGGTLNQFDVTDVGVDFTAGATKVLPGDRVILTDGASHNLVRTVYTVDSATRIHFTADIPTTGWTPGSGQSWRIERTLSDQLVNASFYTINGNTLSVNGSITLNVTGQGAKTVTYAKMYMAYRALRQDLQNLDTVTSVNDITTKIGRLDSRNPLACGAFVSLQNTTTQVQFYGVASNDLAGHTMVRDALASRPDVYAVVPLSADVSIIEMWNADFVGLALPDETEGRPQRFRVVIGSGTLPLTQTLAGPSGTALVSTVTGTAPATIKLLTVPAAGFIAAGIIPGDLVTIAADDTTGGAAANGTFTVAQVVSDTSLEINTAFPVAKTLKTSATIGITAANGTTVKRSPAAASGSAVAARSDLALILADSNATFVTSGVTPGDVIEIPQPSTGTSYAGTLQQFVVNTVLSENRLQIVNNGPNTSTAQNELPRGVSRYTPTALEPTDATVHYQVIRKLTKDEQVTNLVALAQSFKSRRTVLVWPDKVDVAGVVNGSGLPGYYLGCAVGGMTAGLPSHQGFTFIGIAGISQIYDANTYFSDQQMTDLSQGGWYVFAQQTPQSLPYTIHQLTTDVSTLETGEFSVVKNFDFVSMFFVDILEDFLGTYNINDDTIGLVRAAINTGGNTLRLRTYAKIGAPLTSFQINDIGISPVSADRIVTHVAVGLPKPLNVVELHLVA